MILKCWYCNIKDTERDELILHEHITESGNKVNKRYHKECYPKFIEQQKFLDKESEELDYLVEVIKDVHKIPDVHQKFYSFIQELRNGTVLIGKKKKKKYKEGFSYTLIAKTYLFCRADIEYWKKNKDFNDSLLGELKYGWAIINDKINAVKKKEEKKVFQQAKKKAEEKEQHSNDIVSHQQTTVEFKKKKRDDDISDFL
jgi:hypothetical protein